MKPLSDLTIKIINELSILIHFFVNLLEIKLT